MDLHHEWGSTSTLTAEGSSTPTTPQAAVGTGDGTATSDGTAGKAPTLEQELEQMTTLVSGMGKNFGSYWGSFRKQSATAIKQSQAYASSAARDLTPYLDKAKAELDKLGEQARASAAAGQAASTSSGLVNPDAPALSVAQADGEKQQERSEMASAGTDKGKGRALENEADPVTGADTEQKDPQRPAEIIAGVSAEDAAAAMRRSSDAATAFFTRIQSQLSSNPNFQHFQHNLGSMQHDLRQKVDFSKIDLNEATKKYEAAMNQGEKYFKVASKELTELFGEAVRIVPPEEADGAESGAGAGTRGALVGKQQDRRKKEAAVAAAGRKETLLHRLRSDPAVLLVDPAKPPDETAGTERRDAAADGKEAYAAFCKAVEEKGGFEGDVWKARISSELATEIGHVLQATHDSVVPSSLSSSAFWLRYFFRVQQIEEDEARRKEILEGATQDQDEEDFNWDMEDESASSVVGDDKPSDVPTAAAPSDKSTKSSDESLQKTPKSQSTATLPKPTDSSASSDIDDAWGEADADDVADDKAAPAAAATSSAKEASPRNSSEEGGTSTGSSYDVVSRTSGSPKLEKKESAATLGASAKKPQQQDDEDDDSDWE